MDKETLIKFEEEIKELFLDSQIRNEMINRVAATSQDKKELAKVEVTPEDIKDDLFDYSQVVVKKPWGYEYLIFQNEFATAWILYLKPGAKTSMHCHLNKKTSLVILEGEAICSTMKKKIPRHVGEGLMIGKGTFHQTRVTSKNGVFALEIESPVNKRDLVRVWDAYGRAGESYETIDKYAFIPNYNYLTLSEHEIFYNITKRFGQCTLTFKRITNKKELEDVLVLDKDDVCSVLKGNLLDNSGKKVAEVGDTIPVKHLCKAKLLQFSKELELLVIKRNDIVTKVSDYIMLHLKSQNVKEVFFVPGDANVHLVDSLGRDGELNYTCNQTEEAASMAVEAYSKLTSELGVLLISSGASGTNAITGIADAWNDSTPLLVISGQASSDQCDDTEIRQLGNKSLNIVDVVKPIVKYAVKITDPKEVRYHLEKAIYLAREGRLGPVWVDMPIDIQGMTINDSELESFEPDGEKGIPKGLNRLSEVIQLLTSSQRPVILAGNGIRLSGAEDKLLELLKKLNVPVLTSRRGADLISENHPLFFGRPGAYGQRRANFVIQNSDLMISIGARLSIPQIGRNYKTFARTAKKVIVDIDKKELKKKTIKVDIAINASAKDFIGRLLKKIETEELPDYSEWVDRCKEWGRKFPPASKELHKHKKFINPYLFVTAFSGELKENEIIVVDGGPVMNYTMQTFEFKKGQRMISSTGIELPGFALPGSIGSSVANGRKQVVCLCEDHSSQVNIQELQTIIDNKLPIKIFILKSKGYSNIRKIQREYFGGRYIGTDDRILSGSPNLTKIVAAYGFKTFKISKPQNLGEEIRKVLEANGPAICEVQIDGDQELVPRIVFDVNRNGKWEAKPLEDMYPFLDRKTLKDNMIVDVLEE